MCRASAGECDVEETCNGVAAPCPPDRLLPKATLCGTLSWCSGTSTACPASAGEWKVFPDDDRWTWSNPLPQGRRLNWVSGSGPDDVWAVGRGGTILHWDGAAWSQSQSGVTEDLATVWTAAKGDAWATAQFGTTLLHWNGTAWAPSALPADTRVYAVWGAAVDDVWAAASTLTDVGRVLHWDGSAWSIAREGGPVLGTVGGLSSTDVWLYGGTDGSMRSLRWNGVAWEEMAEGGLTLANGVWRLGGGLPLERWDGTAWTAVGSEITHRAGYFFASIWASGVDDALGRRQRSVAARIRTRHPLRQVAPARTRKPAPALGRPDLDLAKHGHGALDPFDVGQRRGRPLGRR
ncbi:MAG: hypothetical protein QM765_34600 [Myxococcales bacterium]